MGRGKGYEGLFIGECAPPSFLRKQDQLRNYLRKHLSSCFLHEVLIDKKDRAIILRFQKMGKINNFSYFWKGRDSYFFHFFHEISKNNTRIYTSWNGYIEKLSETLDLFDIYDELGRIDIEKRNDIKTIGVEQLLHDEEEISNSRSNKTKANKKLEKKIHLIKKDISRIEKLKAIEAKVEDSLFEKEIQDKDVFHFEGFKVKFFHGMSFYQKRNRVYEKIKGFKKALKIQEERLKETQKEIEGKKDVQKQSTLLPIMPIWKSEAKPNKTQKSNESFNIVTFKDMKICYGQNAKENDSIRIKWAKKEDYWFHLESDKSPHIFVKGDSEVILSEELFVFVANIMKKESGLKTSEVNLMYTKVKNLKGVKKSPGKVLYKKEKYRKVVL